MYIYVICVIFDGTQGLAWKPSPRGEDRRMGREASLGSKRGPSGNDGKLEFSPGRQVGSIEEVLAGKTGEAHLKGWRSY